MSSAELKRPGLDHGLITDPSGFDAILRTKARIQSSPISLPTSSSSVLTASNLIPKTPPLSDFTTDTFLPETTLYENSFASRLYGFGGSPGLRGDCEHGKGVLRHRDWDTSTPWMELMEDIHTHYMLKHGLPLMPAYHSAPIDYVALQSWHIDQVHDLLRLSFWPGIDVSTALEDSPEKYTVVALYRRVVVGVALISPPPDDAYVTYITVRAGWQSSGIAMTMLYLLISASPDRDIILHVSANNPAMLLYNKLGFKAEEFIVGFYEDYLDEKDKACRNALRLRLRQS